jgi:NAD(P)-dependent dehydrogenase (short-subunit alcohol dehydrogenase family)
MLFDLRGKHALVTGASRGIGLAVAKALAEQGASVVITGRKLEGLSDAAGQLRAAGADVLPLACHQGDPAAIHSLFAQMEEKGRSPDIAVINAAANPAFGPLMDIDMAAWQKILEVNLTGAFLTARGAAKQMMARKRGSIIFMASVAGVDPMPGIAAYSVSKAGLLGLARALAKELGPAGIHVNAIAPGLIETKFSEALFKHPDSYRGVMKDTPLMRHGQPDDLAGAAVFLASDASAYMTGQVMVIDGGKRV